MRNIVALAALVAVLGTTLDAQAQWYSRSRGRQGGELALGGGLNMCMESGEAKCDRVDPSFAILVSPGFRMSDIIGIYLDITYGRLNPEEGDANYSHFTAMPTLRFFSVLPGAEIFAGIGAGYARKDAEFGDAESSWENFLNMKLNVGGAFKVAPTMDIGVNFDYIFNADGKGEACAPDGSGDKTCADNKGDIEDAIQIIAFAKFHF